MEFIGFVFKFGLIFRNLFLYLGLSGLVFSECNLTGSQRLVNFFKLRLITINLSLQFQYHCLKSLDHFLCLLCIFGEFADIITFIKVLHITAFNTVSTFKTVFAANLFI